MSKAKLLVVDDSPTQLMMYKMALLKEGFEIVTANNGVEALNVVYQETLDLIVSDIMMPEINGYVFCRLIKNDPLKAHIPIILLTGLGQQHDRFWGLEAGASSFIVKDMNTANLINEVKNLLKVKVPSIKLSQGMSLYDSKRETSSDIRTRIFDILDKLLFESSISNKIREIVRYAYDVNELKANLFRLLSNLMEYSIASIAFKMKNNNIISFEVNTQVSQDHLKKVMMRTMKGEKIDSFKLNILGKDKVSDTDLGEFKSELIVPLIDNESWIGFIAVFSYDEYKFEDEDYKILNIFARELVLIIQFITKMAEIDDFKNEFTQIMFGDMILPIEDSISTLNTIKGKESSQEIVDDVIEHVQNNLNKTHQLIEEMTKVLEKLKHEDIK